MASAIVKAAIEIATDEGWPNVTMRKIADKIEYSHAALYEYFPGRSAILLEVVRQGYGELCAAANVALPEHRRGLRMLVEVIWNFALSKPVVYQAMHGLSGVPLTAPAAPEEARRVLEMMIDTLKQLAPSASRSQLEATADTIWSTQHGFISLHLAGQLAGGERRAKRLSRQAANDLVEGLRRRSA